MNPPVPAERPDLENLISQEIACLVVQLMGLEQMERDYLLLLNQKAELERRISYLQEIERNAA